MADQEKKTSKSELKANKKPEKVKLKPRKSPLKSTGSFFKSVKAEIKKVIWPDAKTTLKNTAIVLIVVFIVGICIYAVDTGLSLGLKQTKKVANSTTISAVADESTSTTAAGSNAAAE